MRRFLLLFLLFSLPLNATMYPVSLGDDSIQIQHLQRGPGKTFIHVHRSETTALNAARAYIESDGGTLITLVHKGGRNIAFHLHGKRYEFDPNRIYTDAGIKKTLQRFGPYSLQAHREVKKLADKIKQLLPAGKIIAVHNNQSYSLKDYLPEHPLAKDAQALNFPDKSHYRNFYIATQKTDFFRLKELSFNSVLQARSPTDDGSLSVYLAHQEYINVEAGYDQFSAQMNMLKYA